MSSEDGRREGGSKDGWMGRMGETRGLLRHLLDRGFFSLASRLPEDRVVVLRACAKSDPEPA